MVNSLVKNEEEQAANTSNYQTVMMEVHGCRQVHPTKSREENIINYEQIIYSRIPSKSKVATT